MKKLLLGAAAGVAALSATTAVAEDVNVAFFLEWATPNQIAKPLGNQSCCYDLLFQATSLPGC